MLFTSEGIFVARVALLCMVAGASLMGCDDGEADVENVGDYLGSGCKQEPLVDTEGVLRTSVVGDYSGFWCISWVRDGAGILSVDLINFPGACVSEYEGFVDMSAGTLDLSLTNPGCESFACDGCRYDWSFSAIDTGSASSMTMNVLEDSCPEDEWEGNSYSYEMNFSAGNGELACRYIDPLNLAQASDGEPWSACDSLMNCEGDLQCRRVDGLDKYLCLPPCQSSNDCQLPDLMSCDEGACVLTSPWG